MDAPSHSGDGDLVRCILVVAAQSFRRLVVALGLPFRYLVKLFGETVSICEERKREAQAYFFRYLPLIRFEAQLGVGGVDIRKEIFKLRGVISSSHVRFPALALDAETLKELSKLVDLLGLAS